MKSIIIRPDGTGEHVVDYSDSVIYCCTGDSPFGKYLLVTTETAVCELSFRDLSDCRSDRDQIQSRWPGSRIESGHTPLSDYVATIWEKAGKGPTISCAMMLRGTAFQMNVWKALVSIPFGKLVTYRDVAVNSGRPDAIRAVAGAIAANRIAFLIPCHRVINSSGALGGFRWGVQRKKDMIHWEKTASCATGVGEQITCPGSESTEARLCPQ